MKFIDRTPVVAERDPAGDCPKCGREFVTHSAKCRHLNEYHKSEIEKAAK